MANKMQSKNPPKKKTSVPAINVGPPDGGWGWFVVLGSFMIHVVTDGVTYSFGVLYHEFLSVFKESQSATAWIASLLVGVTLCSGPIASVFVNKYGCRTVTIAGAILATICLVASVFAQSVFTLYITIGLGTGLGFGMIYLPAIVSVTCYFEKYRSLATGIAVCGSGLGTFIFSPLVQFLVFTWDWRTTVAVIAGLVSMCTLFGLLFRPLPDEDQLIAQQSAAEAEESLTMGGGGGGVTATTVVLNVTDASHECQPLNADAADRRSSYDRAPVSDDECGAGEKQPNKTGNTPTTTLDVFGNGLDKQSRFALSQPELIAASLNKYKRDEVCYASQNLKPPHGGGIMCKKDIFYSGSLLNVSNAPRRRTISAQSANTACYAVEMTNTMDCDNFSDGMCCSADAKSTIKQMLDLSLLKDPIFILYTISNFLTSIGFNIPYLFLVPFANSMGIPEDQSSYLLALLGIANTLGRIILGFISDKPWINRLMVYNVCLTVCGIATILCSYCTDFFTFAIYTIVFGSTIGAYVGLTSVILVDLLGLDKLTNAFGILLLFQGIASLIGPPLAGWLYDIMGWYYPAFYLSGANIAASGLMLFIIPFIQRRCEEREHEKMTALVKS